MPTLRSFRFQGGQFRRVVSSAVGIATAFVQYLQELGLLWSYPALQLPQFWYIRTGIFRLCVMDVYAGYTRIQSYSGGRPTCVCVSEKKYNFF